MRATFDRWIAWVTQEQHKQQVRGIKDQVEKAFTEHPHEGGESYLQHLSFTLRMAGLLFTVGVVLLTHGLFPFLFTRTASGQIERVYRVMKSRIPKSRQAELDAGDGI